MNSIFNQKLSTNIQRGKAHWDLAVAIRKGIAVSDTITLGASESDRFSFTQLLVLLREAQDISSDKQQFEENTVTILDINNKSVSLKVKDLRPLLVSYGLKYQELWAKANSI